MAHPLENEYSDDVRLATWAMLAEAGGPTNDPIKSLDAITKADMDAWWAGSRDLNPNKGI